MRFFSDELIKVFFDQDAEEDEYPVRIIRLDEIASTSYQILQCSRIQPLLSSEFSFLSTLEAAYQECKLMNGHCPHKGYKVLPHPTNPKYGYCHHGLKFDLETGRLVLRSKNELS